MEKQKYPEVRFKGYDQNWRLKKLEAIGIFNPYSNLPQEFEYVDLESVVGTELINSRKETIETAPSRAQRLASRGDVFYQAVRPYQKNNYLFDLPYDNYVFSTGYIQIRPTINSYYLLTFVQKNDFVQKVLENCTGTSYPAINTTGLKSIDVFISNEADEQTQIGNFFQNLDQSIALHEKKLAQTQNLKKAMLEKMFPKAGSKQPEIRLKGFSGDWELSEFGKYCDMFNGDRGGNYPNADDMVAVGIPFINAGDLKNGKVNLQYANKITRDKYNQLSGAKIQLGDIVYCLRGTLGKNAYIDNFTEGTVASSLVVIRPKNIIGNYLFQILNSDIEYRQRTLCDEGAAQPNLSARNLAGFLIPITSIEEQKEIGQFFKHLDETIVIQQQQLQTLKNLKQAFLEKMFV